MLDHLRSSISGQQYDLANPELPSSAVLVALTNCNSEPEVLLTRRTKHLSRNPGEVCFPGGKWEEDDADLLVTALRESHEEVGLRPEWVDVVGGLKPIVARSGLNVAPYVGIIDSTLDLQPTSDELDSVFRTPLRFFMDEKNISPYKHEFNGQEFSFPGFVYEGYTIWGLTAYIIVDMVNSVYDAGVEMVIR
ncbi:MAG: CoA pyrophosphatase [Gammaproteobacteria bacterium]|nr:CoA pyrophosphatase [Gammaproteobacteria bacterium]